MQCAYARAFARGVEPLDEDPPAGAALVVGPAPTLATVGDVDPAEQPATAAPSTMAAMGHTFDERIIPPRRHARPSGVVRADRYASTDINAVSGFRYAADTGRAVPSVRHACAHRRRRALHGRSHSGRFTPGSDRRRHRR